MTKTVTYYLADKHPTWYGAECIRLTARTDLGARRQANKIDPQHTMRIYYQASDGAWGKIDR